MDSEHDFARLIDKAPKVMCPGCVVEMTLRTLVPEKKKDLYVATYRCPRCGTDTERVFVVTSDIAHKTHRSP